MPSFKKKTVYHVKESIIIELMQILGWLKF